MISEPREPFENVGLIVATSLFSVKTWARAGCLTIRVGFAVPAPVRIVEWGTFVDKKRNLPIQSFSSTVWR